jgi:hypothetical protein
MGEGKRGNHKIGMHARNHKILLLEGGVPNEYDLPSKPNQSITTSLIGISHARDIELSNVELMKVSDQSLPLRVAQNLQSGQSVEVLNMEKSEQWKRWDAMCETRKGMLKRVDPFQEDGTIYLSLRDGSTTPVYQALNDLIGFLIRKIRDERGSCPLCPAVLVISGSLNSHIRRHLPATFECVVCGALKRTKNDLELHVRKHNEVVPMKQPKSKNTPCLQDGCPAVFQTKAHLEKHMTFVHGLVADVMVDCQACGISLKQPSLKIHQEWHCSERSTMILKKCSECDEHVIARNYPHHMRDQHQRRTMIEDFACAAGIASFI